MVLSAIRDGRRSIEMEFLIMLSFYGCTSESKLEQRKRKLIYTNLHCKNANLLKRPYNKTCCNLQVDIPRGDRAHEDVHLN